MDGRGMAKGRKKPQEPAWRRVLRHLELNPFIVRIDASTVCQLRCPICPNGTGALKSTEAGCGFLKFRDFKEFVDANPCVRIIELSNYGEILLNPELPRILEYAHEKKVRIWAGNGVNLNTASEGLLEALVKFRVERLRVSIDGASNEVYRQYRVGGDFDRVISNVRTINRFKAQYKSEFPHMSWQFVVMGHNEHELPKARRMAKELGMAFNPKASWDSDYSPIRDREFVSRETGGGMAGAGAGSDCSLCMQVWFSPQINWDGKLLGCCVNYWEGMGNVFKDGLKACLGGKKYVQMKRGLMGGDVKTPCSRCPTYGKIRGAGLTGEKVCKSIIHSMRWDLDSREFAGIMECARAGAPRGNGKA
jgi:MoaA/NifB/PqqE/SkfB family radical SAM enzyme